MNANDTPPRLYLTIPPEALEQGDFTRQKLRHFTKHLDIACVSLPVSIAPPSTTSLVDEDAMERLVGDVQRRGIAALADLASPLFSQDRKSFEKALEQAVNLFCDGVHIVADADLFDRAREVLGEDAIVGCDCGLSRHQAMELGERGADYVAFRPQDQTPDAAKELVEMVRWWQELFEVPCVAGDVADKTTAEALAQIPAEFIALAPDLFLSLKEDDALFSLLATRCPQVQQAS